MLIEEQSAEQVRGGVIINWFYKRIMRLKYVNLAYLGVLMLNNKIILKC